METKENGENFSCEYKLRENPLRRKEKVFVGCGAGFGGDRLQAALKLLRTVKELDYLVLECLAERTLAERYQLMMSGGKGYDTRTVKFVRNMQAYVPRQSLGLDVNASTSGCRKRNLYNN